MRISIVIEGLIRYLQRIRVLPTKLRSGTSKCPTRIEVFNTAMDSLVSQGRIRDRVYFKPLGGKRKAICEVSWAGCLRLMWQPTEREVLIKLPCKDSFVHIFNGQEIEIPRSWELDYFKRGKCIRFRVRKEDAETIGAFLDMVFKRIYGCSDDCSVEAHIPADQNHFV
jgi:hypothetical protein